MKINTPITSTMSSDWKVAKEQLGEEFHQLTSSINAGWRKEHNSDGTHNDIHADSIAFPSYTLGEIISLDTLPSRFYHWSFSATNTELRVVSSPYTTIMYVRTGHLVNLWFAIRQGLVHNNGASPATEVEPLKLCIYLPEFKLIDSPGVAKWSNYYDGGLVRWIEIGGYTGGRGIGSARVMSTDPLFEPTRPQGTTIEIFKETGGFPVGGGGTTNVNPWWFDIPGVFATANGFSGTVLTEFYGSVTFLAE